MRQNRRTFLLQLVSSSIAHRAAAESSTTSALKKPQPLSDTPDPGTFQSGDFVWPKNKGVLVPRRAAPQSSDGQKVWNAEREALLRSDRATSGLSEEVAEKLRNMSYEEFKAIYFATALEHTDEKNRSRKLTIPTQAVYVGHVGIIEKRANEVPHIVEATVSEGLKGAVVRHSYRDWLKSHRGKQIWHGRVRDLSVGTRHRIAQEALSQLGKPYGFFNFDLDDDTSFYCSKLVWMSIWRATSGRAGYQPIAVDGDSNPKRPFFGWFSPKQLINAKHIAVLHKPGEY